MSSDATDAAAHDPAAVQHAAPAPAPADKGKGKVVDDSLLDDDDDQEDEAEEEDDDDDDDEMEEDNLEEIDPSVILAPGARRSTRGVRVDYASAEALQKAGLQPEQVEEDEHEDSFVANDDDMKDD